MFNQLGRAFTPTNNHRVDEVSRTKRWTQHEVLITPEYAKQLLAMSQGNRTPSRSNLKYYTKLMKNGEWVNTGEEIIISQPTKEQPMGILLDGHTRLTACIHANAAFESDIKWNVPFEAMASMDTGGTRTPTHHLEILGIKNQNAVSSVYNKLHAYVNKYYMSRDKPHASALKNEMAEWWLTDEHADLTIARKTHPIMNGALAQTSAIVILRAGCAQQYVEQFFDDLVKGAGLDDGNAILTLRNALNRADIQNLSKNTSTYHRYIGMVINMFNHWVSGRSCQKVYPPKMGYFVQPIIPPHARANNIQGGK